MLWLTPCYCIAVTQTMWGAQGLHHVRQLLHDVKLVVYVCLWSGLVSFVRRPGTGPKSQLLLVTHIMISPSLHFSVHQALTILLLSPCPCPSLS